MLIFFFYFILVSSISLAGQQTVAQITDNDEGHVQVLHANHVSYSLDPLSFFFSSSQQISSAMSVSLESFFPDVTGTEETKCALRDSKLMEWMHPLSRSSWPYRSITSLSDPVSLLFVAERHELIIYTVILKMRFIITKEKKNYE